jgi:capsular polysaccharide biosynthesis protein
LGILYARLQTISPGLALKFVDELLRTKRFDQRDVIAEKYEDDFLESAFSQSLELKVYAKRLVDLGATGRMQALVRFVKVVGNQVEPSRMISYVEANIPLVVSAWFPRSSELTFQQLPNPKKIEVDGDSIVPVDNLDRLKQTSLGVFYLRRLKQFPLARQMALWLWKKGYPFYINKISVLFSGLEVKKWRKLTPLNQFAFGNNLQVTDLTEAASVELRAPPVYPRTLSDYVQRSNEQFSFPQIFVTKILNGTVYGATNLVLWQDLAIHHDLYDFARDYTSEELHGRAQIDPGAKRVRWLQLDSSIMAVPRAATFVDASASNYAHWLTEVLPRIALFRRQKSLNHVPIAINEGLHKNIMESLALCVGSDCEIITLPAGRALLVDELYVTSVVGYVPFDRRTNKLDGHSHGRFSPNALNALRDQLSFVTLATSSEFWPERIFLRRNSHARKLVNESEIEALVVSHGYSIVEPEKLSFSQQIKLFANAKVILGPAGAALANAVFCRSGAHVGILSSKHKSMSYGYWVAILDPLDIHVSYILGDIVKNHESGVHGDFEVDASLITEFLSSTEKTIAHRSEH